MQILCQHKQKLEMQQLKTDISQFLASNFGPDHYTSLNDALIGLFSQGLITEDDRNLLRELSFNNDKQFFSAWETYIENKDEDEFVQTLQILCSINRKKNQGNN